MKAAWKWLLVPMMMVLLAVWTAPVMAAEGGAHGEAAVEAHGGAHEQPQLFSPPTGGLVTAVTTLLVFALLLAVLGRFAWGPIAAGLKAREDRIRRDIADAEETRKKAEATLREYNAKLTAAEDRVRELINNATAQGERMATDIRMRAQQEAEESRQRTVREIDAAKNQAIAEIYDQAAGIATSMAEKILRRAITADDQRDLVRRGLEQVQTVDGNGQNKN